MPARSDKVLDVTVVILDAGYASTAIAPIEIFHSAGTIWQWLNGQEQQPRFRVRTASLDGRPVVDVWGGWSDVARRDPWQLPA